jgi:iron-sulfur cluster repair protein YtfE (RIC family)
MDIHSHNPVDDAHLTQALSELMTHLRKTQYGVAMGHFEEALGGSADAFVDTLARHLLYEESVLFPSLRRLDSGIAQDIRSLQAEHARLRELSLDLARSIQKRDTWRAYDIARTFLAELFDHIEREAKVTHRPAHPQVASGA